MSKENEGLSAFAPASGYHALTPERCGIRPYYQDDAVTIYHGDCRQIVPLLGKFDLLLTDPPYGINADNRKRIMSRGKLAAPKDYGESNWDAETPPAWCLEMFNAAAGKSIVWGGNYFAMPPSSCWLVWDKLNGENDFADCELAWTNMPRAVRRITHQWNGMIRKGGEDRFHPTQKPLDVMTWCIAQAGDGVRTILDPFAGSGTTGRAAKDMGRKAVLIEREERYCEIAARRMAQEVLPLHDNQRMGDKNGVYQSPGHANRQEGEA